MRRRATAAVRARLYATTTVRSALAKVRPRALVLTYHRIGEPAHDPFGQAVTPATFASHLQILRSNYRVQSVDDLVRTLHDGRLEDGTVVVTFDDGYADVMLEAAPISAEHQVPLHLFVAVQPVVDGTRFWWDRLAAAVLTGDGNRPVRLGELELELDDGKRRTEAYRVLHARLKSLPTDERTRQLDQVLAQVAGGDAADFGRPLTAAELSTLGTTPGVGIGAHTLSHPMLAALSPADQRRELAESRIALTDLIGRDVDTVAYPFGKGADIDADTRRLAAEVGYIGGFTTIAEIVRPKNDPLALPRLTVHESPAEVFRARLKAIFGF